MGEIGIPRTEYLYDLLHWEIVLITRGYWRRFHTSWEQARLVAYQTRYCMGLGKNESPKTISEWLPFPWEGIQSDTEYTEEEISNIQKELEAFREQKDADTGD